MLTGGEAISPVEGAGSVGLVEVAHLIEDVKFYDGEDGTVWCTCGKVTNVPGFATHRDEVGARRRSFSHLAKPRGLADGGPRWLRSAKRGALLSRAARVNTGGTVGQRQS